MWRVSILVAACLAVGCVGSGDDRSPRTPARCPKVRRTFSLQQQVVDLTHRMHGEMAYWPGGVPFSKEIIADYDQGYRAHKFEMGENTGTHLDAPSHFVPTGRSVHELPAEQLVVPAVVMDLTFETKDDPDYVIEGTDIVDWEAVHGPVPIGSLVIFNTGWHERFEDPASYANQDDEGTMHFPGLGPEGAKLLVEREVAGVGIDTLSVDPGAATELEAHHVMLENDKYQLENLANLDALPPTGATVVVGVLPVLDGTQAQARVIAFVPEAEEEEDERP